MILYHGSLETVEQPRIMEVGRQLDFGRGFYTTTSLQQALRWVRLRMEQQKVPHGYVNRYEYDGGKVLRTRQFRGANEAWVDFVHNNRTVPGYEHDYDVVIGPVANDNVYLSFNLYEAGLISKGELIRRLKTYKLVDQYLFHTDMALTHLKYIGNKEVKR